jgi:Na+/H+ antiporter NhaD/arsenite permease-like protein
VTGINGASLSLLWIVPFAGLLLSIAFVPPIAHGWWSRHDGKVVAWWSLLAVGPLFVIAGPDGTMHELVHVVLLDYVPFIILLASLFTVTGGIRIAGSFTGTPLANTTILLVGTVLAGWMGTTGASMLLVRTVILANERRRHNVHVVIFFIFLVSNIGGALSPLGDPPLFLGFLRGVDFFWPTVHLFTPTVMIAGILLAVFFCLDTVFYRREAEKRDVPEQRARAKRIEIRGGANFLFLAGIILAVMLSGSYDLGPAFHVHGIAVGWTSLLRDLALVALMAGSLFLVNPAVRRENRFTWAPMAEVAKFFAGIFLTIVPVLAILREGEDGAMSGIHELLMLDGRPVDAAYFWLTGALSSVLDNAPTYLVFFNAAGGDPAALMGPLATTLTAISAGAVYMGAVTYIGNAPNFMVKTIAELHAIRMPSFFGYLGWSCVILVPTFLLVTLVFFPP